MDDSELQTRKIKAEDAVGMTLAHDLTRIVPGEVKEAKFEKGDVIAEEDIPLLKKTGNDHIYVINLSEDQLHENEAALRITETMAGPGVNCTEPTEGKVKLFAKHRGLLKVDRDLLIESNEIGEILVSSRHTNTPVREGGDLGGARINHLAANLSQIEKLERLVGNGDVFSVKPFSAPDIGLVVTGNEVYNGRIEDEFSPTLTGKLQRWKGSLMDSVFVPDDEEQIARALLDMRNSGADILIAAGGMSVDPDDLTPAGIRNTGAEVITHGVPALPGNKLMLAYLEEVPVIGLPACFLFDRTTTFDLIYPRILAGEVLEQSDLNELSHGGYCLHCDTCTYPQCSFGKG